MILKIKNLQFVFSSGLGTATADTRACTLGGRSERAVRPNLFKQFHNEIKKRFIF